MALVFIDKILNVNTYHTVILPHSSARVIFFAVLLLFTPYFFMKALQFKLASVAVLSSTLFVNFFNARVVMTLALSPSPVGGDINEDREIEVAVTSELHAPA